jgi:hypothetical protein
MRRLMKWKKCSSIVVGIGASYAIKTSKMIVLSITQEIVLDARAKCINGM